MVDKEQNIKERGTITVFLSFILLFILSLVLITIEGARTSVARVFVERALTTAMDSSLAEFYGPLMSEYHLLGLDCGYGSDQDQVDMLQEQIKDYITYTTLPNDGLNNPLLPEGINLYNISINSLDIEDKTKILDYDGKLFIHEAAEYMKYREIGDIFELLRDKLLKVEEAGKVNSVYKEKQKMEEKLVEIDKNILKLMTLLDGIKTGKKGLKTSKKGELTIEKYFVKKIFYGKVSMDDAGINNEIVYQALENEYVDLSSYFTLMNQEVDILIETDQKVNDLEGGYASVQTSLDNVNQRLNELNTLKEETKNSKKQKKELNKEKDKLKKVLKAIEQDISEYSDQVSSHVSKFNVHREYIETLIQHIRPLLEETIDVLDKITNVVHNSKGLIDGFKTVLANAEKDMDNDTYASLNEGLEDIKKYIGDSGVKGYDFEGMKEIARENISILNTVQLSLDSAKQSLSTNSLESVKYHLESSITSISNYNIRGLAIDYSTLVLQKNDGIDPLESIGDLIKDGFLGLVMDTDSISKLCIESQKPLPSQIRKISGKYESFNLKDMFLNMEIGNSNTDISDALSDFQTDVEALSAIEQGVNAIAERILFQQYLLKHFYNYRNHYDGSNIKPSELGYELEYLIAGNDKDKDNIANIISKIMFSRTIMNFITILGDSAKRDEAKAISVALVGFTGLPILVNITQTIIMIILAFSESLVDTCGMLMGKSVPMLKKKSDIIMNYGDMLLLNHDFIKGKASTLKETEPFGTKYQDFINLLLLMKKKEDLAFRTMDLIQENLHVRYEDKFFFENCYFGLKVSLGYSIDSKFTNFTFLKDYNSHHGSSYQYETKASYSY